MSAELDGKLDATARWLREYGLSDNNKAWVTLFKALTESLKDELLYAAPETVPQLQAQARQLHALQDVVLSSIPTNGRA